MTEGADVKVSDTRPYTMAELERALPPRFDRVQQWHYDWLRSVTPVVDATRPLCLMGGIA